MNKQVVNILKSLIGLLLGFGLLWLAVKDQSLEEIKNTFKSANYWWIAFGMSIAILSHLFRALRWKMLIKATGHESNTGNLFASIMVGYLVNLAVPRAGEISRASLTGRTEGFALSTSLGTIFTDRVFDLIFLGTLVLSVFLIEIDQVMIIVDEAFAKNPDPGQVVSAGFPWKWVALGIVVAGGVSLFLFRKKLLKLSLAKKIIQFLKDMWTAILSVRNMKKGWLFVLYSVGIWICYILMTYVCFFALEETSNLPFSFAMIAFTLGGIGMVIPSPGGIGSYHYAFSLAFWAYWSTIGMDSPEMAKGLGTSLAFVIHTSQMVMMIVIGFLSYLYLIPKLSKGKNKDQEEPSA